MNLLDVVRRRSVPQPWEEGDKIPWDDPDFSRRMLDVHLSQAHDAASRRFEIVDAQVDWIHQTVLGGHPTRILDLGCGPGLYTERLARRGHQCVGLDFSPASIAHAQREAETAGLDCRYLRHDIRSANYGAGFGLVMSLFGELNVFRPQDAKGIVAKAHAALTPEGLLLVEAHTHETVVALGRHPPSWESTENGLFSDHPHLTLRESIWDAQHGVAIQRYFVVEALTGEVTCHSSSTQAYTRDDYAALLRDCGFGELTFHPALGESPDRYRADLLVIVARKTA